MDVRTVMYLLGGCCIPGCTTDPQRMHASGVRAHHRRPSLEPPLPPTAAVETARWPLRAPHGAVEAAQCDRLGCHQARAPSPPPPRSRCRRRRRRRRRRPGCFDCVPDDQPRGCLVAAAHPMLPPQLADSPQNQHDLCYARVRAKRCGRPLRDPAPAPHRRRRVPRNSQAPVRTAAAAGCWEVVADPAATVTEPG
jgi:hypothetical protein